jgi:polyisoprenoid-binding protein YceI
MSKVTTFLGLFASSAALTLGSLGCDKSPAPAPTARSHGTLVEAGQQPVPPPGSKAVFYKFGPPDSKIAFSAAKVTKTHDGSFGHFEGTIGLVNGDPLMSAVQVLIDMDSVTTDVDKLSKHLKSADFFDVAQFPKANFSSTTVRPGSAPSTYNVTGKLSLHGVIKPLTFPATIKVSNDGVDVDAELTLNRKDYGIVYPGAPDDLIRDDISIKVTAHARPGPAEPAKKEGAPAADARIAD